MTPSTRLLQALRGEGKPRHALQRPHHFYIPDLRAQPWWDHGEFPWVRNLERQYAVIRQEVEALLAAQSFYPYETPVGSWHEGGSWDFFYLSFHGRRYSENMARCPQTAAAVEAIPGRMGLIGFSNLAAGTHLPAHSSHTNAHLRCHLGVIVPEGCEIRVGTETRQWQEGRCLIFDDSFDHEVWHRGHRPRVNLLIDIYHPDLTSDEMAFMEEAQRTGPFVEQLRSWWEVIDVAHRRDRALDI